MKMLRQVTGAIDSLFLLNRVIVYLLSTVTLFRADCLTPIQLFIRSECYLYNVRNLCYKWASQQAVLFGMTITCMYCEKHKIETMV